MKLKEDFKMSPNQKKKNTSNVTSEMCNESAFNISAAIHAYEFSADWNFHAEMGRYSPCSVRRELTLRAILAGDYSNYWDKPQLWFAVSAVSDRPVHLFNTR
jgi:hypothetical protein